MEPLAGGGAGAGGEAPGARVFLSHSTKEELPQRVRDRIAEELRAGGYRVLLDKDGLRLGEGWRNALELWIGSCDAAVVLLSEQALTSPFVAHEVSVLSYRQRFQQDPSFVLIPVLIAPVSHAAVDASPLGASFLTALEPVRIAAAPGTAPRDERVLDLEEGVATVLARLDEAALSDGPLEEKLEELTALLETVPDYLLRREAGRLRVHFEETWLPSGGGETRRLGRQLACALLGAPLSEAKESLFTIRQYLRPLPGKPASAPASQAVDLVASSWVSNRSAEEIRSGLDGGATAFCADCSRPLTAQMYVARACTQPLIEGNRWQVAEVDGVVGEGAAAELEAQVASQLELLRGVPTGQLDEELEEIRRESMLQVFVTLPGEWLDVATLDHLRQRFAGVTFFLLTGATEPAAQVLGKARIARLQPPFGGRVEHADYPPLDEARFEEVYRQTCSVVTGKRS